MTPPTSAPAADRQAELVARAETLRGLHLPGRPLLLANAWDAGSARAVAAAGLPAVATSSGAVAEALGWADGEQTPVAEMLDTVARISRAVDLPVTADLERGYRLGPAEFVERLLAAGAVGCNLEDSDGTGALVDPDRQAEYLAGVRAAADRAGVPVVINARVDSYLRGTGTPEQRLADAVSRGRRYLAAGADCVYPIFASEPAAIRALVEQLGGAVNILARPGAPEPAELARLGVARISLGRGLYDRVQQFLRAELVRTTAATG